ncbi:unknown protein [Seminavis robusta]|uniref:Uncharacterized protein n=1 Tax=Seminavis robusta TaxID=568900 RepID=A0A9N8DB77_9STRA|nr:unknown protein [Seminavis robusta]|eukprot:Sro66_g037192.1  (119) ;mRNA; f:74754-75110
MAQNSSLTPTKTYRSQKKAKCFDCESNTGPSDLQSDALPTELSKQSYLFSWIHNQSFYLQSQQYKMMQPSRAVISKCNQVLVTFSMDASSAANGFAVMWYWLLSMATLLPCSALMLSS